MLDDFLHQHMCCAECAADGYKKVVNETLRAFVEMAMAGGKHRGLDVALTSFHRQQAAKSRFRGSAGHDFNPGADDFVVTPRLGAEWRRGMHSEFGITPCGGSQARRCNHLGGLALKTSRVVKTGKRGPQFFEANVRIMYGFMQIGRGAEDVYTVASCVTARPTAPRPALHRASPCAHAAASGSDRDAPRRAAPRRAALA